MKAHLIPQHELYTLVGDIIDYLRADVDPDSDEYEELYDNIYETIVDRSEETDHRKHRIGAKLLNQQIDQLGELRKHISKDHILGIYEENIIGILNLLDVISNLLRSIDNHDHVTLEIEKI